MSYIYGLPILLLLAWTANAGKIIDKKCIDALTHNDTHKHLKYYSGYIR